MVTREYVRTMGRYNAWQNKALRDTFLSMSVEDLNQDRGAFFGSLMGTANHLLWGDILWMSRFDGGEPPQGGINIPNSVSLTSDVEEWALIRHRTDGRIRRWADGVRSVDLTGDLEWFSGAMQRTMSKPIGACIAHFFNHQTHHRGQIHAMLTAAGQTTIDTDLPFMPEDI